MKKRLSYLFLIAICVILGASTAACYKPNTEGYVNEGSLKGMIPTFTEQEIILNSDLIIEGVVSEIGKSKWSNPDLEPYKRNILQTDITIEILDIISGDYDDKIAVVRIDKGFDMETDFEVAFDGYPDFELSERVILFLSRDDGDLATDENYFVLTGMLQGKYLIEDNRLKTVGYNEYFNIAKEELVSRIEKEKAENPDWKTLMEIRKEETRKNNIELFGE